MSNYELRETKTAAEFLDQLEIRNWLEEGEYRSSWIFRGQANANWHLSPTAFRTQAHDKVVFPIHPTLGNLVIELMDAFEFTGKKKAEVMALMDEQIQTDDTYSDEAKKQLLGQKGQVYNFFNVFTQRVGELLAVYHFSQLADELGHPIPFKGQSWDMIESGFGAIMDRLQNSLELFAENPSDFMNNPKKYRAIEPEIGCDTALAQHHGVPTRLLDWTSNPMIAAYFAASHFVNVKTDLEQEPPFCVWLLNREWLDHSQQLNRFKILTCLQSENEYLRMQKGLFVYDTEANLHFLREGYWPSMDDDKIDFYLNETDSALIKITVPAREAPAIMRALRAEGISLAHLMPTYDNIVAQMKIESGWLSVGSS